MTLSPKMAELLHFGHKKNFPRKSKNQFYLSLSDNQVQFHKNPMKRVSKKFKSVTSKKNFSNKFEMITFTNF